MGLFTRNKGREEQQRQQQQQLQQHRQQQLLQPHQPQAPIGAAGQPRPPSFLAATSPQPQPSTAQYHQELFRQHYSYAQSQQPPGPGQQVGPGAPPYPPFYKGSPPGNAGTAASVTGQAGTNKTTLGGDDAGGSLLRQAVREAAAAGKPLAFDFWVPMPPPIADNPYGVPMSQMCPCDKPAAGSAVPPPGCCPCQGQNPYEATSIPALPDMKALPPDLQQFREQCAAGVRQAVAMVTAMEHQLWWERSRRQQAEEDCKVLLGAVQLERGLGEGLMEAETRRKAAEAAAGSRLTLAAEELPQASEAATTIQKHVRGHIARKEFTSHLRDILRGVDPSLDPAALPAGAQQHISHVNAAGAPQRLGLHALMDDVLRRSAGGGGSLPPQQADAASYYRRQVDRIGQRLAGYKDAGEPHPGDTSGDPLMADVKKLLAGSYGGSTAQVIAALVRRCRELQAALLEVSGQLDQEKLSNQGLKDANAQVAGLSSLRADLEAARHDNIRLAAQVAKLRTHLSAATAAGATARENPYVAAWYRRAYADQEWGPQAGTSGGGGGAPSAPLDGPDAAVETWADLRASCSIPEPVMMAPRVGVPGRQYRDLLALQQDMTMTASQQQQVPTPGAAAAAFGDPLYGMHVPDRSSFLYEADTPLMAMQSAAPIIRESGLMMGMPPLDASSYPPSGPGTAAAYPSPRQGAAPPGRPRAGGAHGSSGGGGGGGGGGNGGPFSYNRDTPVVPVYSVLPLIREDEFVQRSMSPPRDPLPPPGTPQRQTSYGNQPPQPPTDTVAAAAVAVTQPQQRYIGGPGQGPGYVGSGAPPRAGGY